MKPKGIVREAFECECGCGFNALDWQLKIELEDCLFYFLDKYPDKDINIQITSGNRCKEHNLEVYRIINEERLRMGQEPFSIPNSKHTAGIACDFYITNVSIEEVYAYLIDRHTTCYGIKRYSSWVHFDIRSSKWRG